MHTRTAGFEARYIWLICFPVVMVLLGGCSKREGFQIVPEHQDLGFISTKEHMAVAMFKIVNGLSVPVKIENIYPSCSCASVKLKKNPIPAKEETTLEVTADLSKLAGKHSFSVRLITDNPSFPLKRISFDAVAPAFGTRERSFSIGTFYPEAVINLEMPVKSVTFGSIEPIVAELEDKGVGITAKVVNHQNGQSVLAIKGIAPNSPGVFSQKILFREVIPGDATLTEGHVELELSGSVVARWAVQREYYCGFLSFDRNDPVLTVNIDRNVATKEEEERDVARVLVTSNDEWIYSVGCTVDDKIRIRLVVDSGRYKNVGASQASIGIRIEYRDGKSESYASKVYFYAEPHHLP